MEKQDDGPRSVNSHICDAVVRLLREYTGRGPNKAKATINGESVMVLLGDTLNEANSSWSRPARGTGCCSSAMTFRR